MNAGLTDPQARLLGQLPSTAPLAVGDRRVVRSLDRLGLVAYDPQVGWVPTEQGHRALAHVKPRLVAA